MVVLSVWRREPRTFWRYGEWSTCFPHPFLFYFCSMTHSQHVCVGVAKSALEMHSVVQLCCYFVVFWFCTFTFHTLTERAEAAGDGARDVEGCAEGEGVGDGSCTRECSWDRSHYI